MTAPAGDPGTTVLVLRPYKLRFVAVGFAVVLTLLYVLGWFALPAQYTAEVNLGQVLTLLSFLFFFVGALIALAGCRVRVDDEGLVIRNGIRSYDVPWARVHQFLFRTGDPWASVLLTDEDGSFSVDLDAEKRQLMAVQTHDGQRARDAVAELRRRHAQWLAVSRSRGT